MSRNLGSVSTVRPTQKSSPSAETNVELQSKPADQRSARPSPIQEPACSPTIGSDFSTNGPEAQPLMHTDKSAVATSAIIQPTATKAMSLSPHLSHTAAPTGILLPSTKEKDTVMIEDNNASHEQSVTERDPAASINQEHTRPNFSSPRKVPGSPDPRSMQRPVNQSKLPITPAARLPTPTREQSKVSKPRRKTTQPSTRTNLAASAQASVTSAPVSETSMPTQEDLLDVLVARYKHDKQVRNQERMNHATVVQDLRDISDNLWEQLQAERSRGQELGDSLSRYEAKMPAWNTKIKKLSDYVHGLTNDHYSLRDKAKEIQEDQAELQHAKTQINTDLDNINQSLSDSALRSSDALNQAKLDMHLLLQQSQNQEAQLHDNARLLASERETNRSHSTTLAQLISSHNNLTENLTEHQEVQSAKLSTLLEKLTQAPVEEKQDPVEELKAFIQQCLTTTLGAFHNVGTVKAEDVQRLDARLENYAGR